jgi:hypothetical protein
MLRYGRRTTSNTRNILEWCVRGAASSALAATRDHDARANHNE